MCEWASMYFMAKLSGMNELAAGGMDGQNGTGRLPHHFFGYAAQQEMSRDAATVCPHDNQINLAVGGEINDFRMRRTVPKMPFDIQAVGVLFSDPVFETHLSIRFELFAGRQRITFEHRQVDHRVFNHVQQM